MNDQLEKFNKEAAKSVKDVKLHTQLSHARHRYYHNFDDAVTQFSNLETAKRRAAFARWKALENLDKYLIEFEANFIRSGGKVIWAQHAAEACSEIISIINRSGEKKIVKSGSVSADEIRLDEQLTLNKKEFTNTDLGKYILQLSGEESSHMVVPAIHKSQEEITSLFNDRIGKTNGSIEALSAIAAKKIRESYAGAGIGISGADFLVADAGAVSVSESEGNSMLVASKTKIQFVIAGIDKVIPSLSDLHVLLPLLSTYASGEKMMAYHSLLRGPRKSTETDGPTEMYVVLIDNGRSNVLAKELQRNIFSCIRCGACLQNDPVYSVIGGQPYNSAWMGPPGAIIQPHIHEMKTHGFFTHLSTLSAADTEKCPVNINFNKLILDNRKQAADQQVTGTGEKLFYYLWKRTMLKRELLNMKGIRAGSFFVSQIFLKSPTGLRKMKKPAKESFNEIWRRRMGGG